MAKPKQARQKTIKEQIDEYLLPFLIGVVVATGTIVASVMAYFCHAEISGLKGVHDTQVSALQNQLASINRRLAGGDFLNVAKFVVTPAERRGIPASDRFFSADLFYAAMPQEWAYEEMKDIDLWNAIYGQEGDKPDNALTGIAPIHVWRRGAFVRLGGNGLINNITPLITVQRFPNKQLLTQLGIDMPEIDPHETPDVKELLKKLHRPSIFQGDIVGAVLAQNFSLVFDKLRFVEGVNVELVTINKVGNVLYSQVLITLTKGSINGVKFDVHYLSLENIVISTKDNLYVISDVIPSDDPSPRGAVAAEVTQWLNDFAILP